MAKVRRTRSAILLHRARGMRAEDTPAEARLWQCLRAHRLGGWKWKRQVQCGPFILDFLCDEARLVVEVDGASHFDRADYDARRTAVLQQRGLRVIRFTNAGVLQATEGVCLAILDACGGERGDRRSAGCDGSLAGADGEAEPPSP